ncbi:acyltransferase family protein [Paenibacillus rhizosphaerae]|uniref:acyltransferase family protein n=1 Tax=Paenibacillus rhizosphaerae TaxID=297318 RepID=UPI001613C9CA
MNNPGQARYIPGLDGIRALAVCAVIAYHLNLGWFPGGFLGVGMFFVLSGYLITDLLIRQWEGTGRIDLRDFWIRRAWRLLPPCAPYCSS